MPFSRLAGVAGLLFIALIVANIILLGDQPLSGDGIAEIRDYVSSDEDRHKAALFLGVLVLPPAVILFAGVVAHIRESDRLHGDAWAIVALGGAILLGAAAGIGDVMYGTAVFRGGEGLDDAALRAVWDAQIVAYSSTGVGLATLATATAVATLWRGAWPDWFGFLSVLVAVAGLLAPISMVSDSNGGSAFGFIGFIAMLVWALAASVLLLRPDATRLDAAHA